MSFKNFLKIHLDSLTDLFVLFGYIPTSLTLKLGSFGVFKPSMFLPNVKHLFVIQNRIIDFQNPSESNSFVLKFKIVHPLAKMY